LRDQIRSLTATEAENQAGQEVKTVNRIAELAENQEGLLAPTPKKSKKP